jgi:hypothetical protein
MFRSRSQPVAVNASATVDIAVPAATVMDFLLDPVSAVMTGRLTERCVHLPDTPERAVGMQHMHFSMEGGLLVAEVEELVELDYPHRAVTVNRTTPGGITVAYTCAPRGRDAAAHTQYTQEVWMQPSPGSAELLQELFDAETHRCAQRVKQVLESGEWRPPASTG